MLFTFFNIMPSSLNRSVGNRAVIAKASPHVPGARAIPGVSVAEMYGLESKSSVRRWKGLEARTTSWFAQLRATDTKPTAPRALGRFALKDSAMDQSNSETFGGVHPTG